MNPNDRSNKNMSREQVDYLAEVPHYDQVSLSPLHCVLLYPSGS